MPTDLSSLSNLIKNSQYFIVKNQLNSSLALGDLNNIILSPKGKPGSSIDLLSRDDRNQIPFVRDEQITNSRDLTIALAKGLVLIETEEGLIESIEDSINAQKIPYIYPINLNTKSYFIDPLSNNDIEISYISGNKISFNNSSIDTLFDAGEYATKLIISNINGSYNVVSLPNPNDLPVNYNLILVNNDDSENGNTMSFSEPANYDGSFSLILGRGFATFTIVINGEEKQWKLAELGEKSAGAVDPYL